MRIVEIQLLTKGRPAIVRAEIAESQAEKEIGLSQRSTLDPGEGLYLPFEPCAPARLWMRDALIALDMIFVDPDGKVSAVVERARPGGETMYWSPGYVSGVLELAAGEAARLGVKPGVSVAVA